MSYLQELRDPPAGRGVEVGGLTTATLQWYDVMDAALCKSSPGRCRKPKEVLWPPCPLPLPGKWWSQKQPGREALIDLLKEQGEKKEERTQQQTAEKRKERKRERD